MISNLTASNFRCFEAVNIQFSPNLNLIYGDNGSGKTSIIEMIYLLGRAQSFRTNFNSDLIHSDFSESIVFASGLLRTSKEELTSHLNFRVGCQLDKSGILIKLNTETLKKRSDLLDVIPLQIITPTSHELIDHGPSNRRKFIDWGLFHVEQGYRKDWTSFRKVLKQRNFLLKTHCNKSELAHWDDQFILYAQDMTSKRRQYFEDLQPFFHEVQTQLFGFDVCTLSLFPGWNDDSDSLQEVLKNNYDRDVKLGWTSVGPHKADIKFRFVNSSRNKLSRGQQKILVFSLQIAQCLHLQESTSLTPILLIDDVISELDKRHINNVVRYLKSINIQVIFTATDVDLNTRNMIDAVFHVEQGKVITEMTG